MHCKVRRTLCLSHFICPLFDLIPPILTLNLLAQDDDGTVSSSADTVGNMKFREKTRRLPPCMCLLLLLNVCMQISISYDLIIYLCLALKLNDPTARPPIVLSGLGPGLDQLSRSRSFSPEHLPQISVAHANVQMGKEGEVGDDILASMARLNAQLDILGD
jgi:hypothetical protein